MRRAEIRQWGRWWPVYVVITGSTVILLGLTGSLGDREYSVLTNGLQAVGVVLALGLGAATLRRDSHDRRVDRVLGMHQELMTGDLWGARHRLAAHLRRLGNGQVTPLSRADVHGKDGKASYGADHPYAKPVDDIDLLLRFFERANSALTAGAVDQALLAELIAVHAIWWNRAIQPDPGWLTRTPLDELSQWFHRYIDGLPPGDARRTRWVQSVNRDFPPPTT